MGQHVCVQLRSPEDHHHVIVKFPPETVLGIASSNFDWNAAKKILEKKPSLKGQALILIASARAASARRTKQAAEFVTNLVNEMVAADLKHKDSSGNTALCVAATSGDLKMVDIMVKKNKDLPNIPGSKGMMPLYMACEHGKHDVVKYLFNVSNGLRDDPWTDETRASLLRKCVEGDMFGIAVQILNDHPKLASDGELLRILARKPDAFVEKSSNFLWRSINWAFSFVCRKEGHPKKDTEALELLRIIWNDIAKKTKKEIDDIIRGPADVIKKDRQRPPIKRHVGGSNKPKQTYSLQHVLLTAAEMGNTKFLGELIHLYPTLQNQVIDNYETILRIAVEHRHEGIYNLLYEIDPLKLKELARKLDANDNNMLHLVSKIAKKTRCVRVAPFEMLRALLWFKEVESLMPTSDRERTNKDGLTPLQLFTQEHRRLAEDSEKWMKTTTAHCMMVATVIATVMFATAFTVPGGYNQTNGIPIFKSKAIFMVFVVADAISLFSSTTSILTFLSILTSDYTELDCSQSLAEKLMLGVATLFLSITTMTITFSVGFFILYYNHLRWVPILVTLFVAMPVILFAWLICPLLERVYHSTYGAMWLFRRTKPVRY